MEDGEARFAALQARLHPILTGPPGRDRPLVVVSSYGFEPIRVVWRA